MFNKYTSCRMAKFWFLLSRFLQFIKPNWGRNTRLSLTFSEDSIRSKLVGFQTKSTLKLRVHSVGTSVIPFSSRPTSSPNELGILITWPSSAHGFLRSPVHAQEVYKTEHRFILLEFGVCITESYGQVEIIPVENIILLECCINCKIVVSWNCSSTNREHTAISKYE